MTVVARQVVLPLDPLGELASGILQESLPGATVSELHVFRDDGILIQANIRDSQTPERHQLEMARARISSAIAAEVELDIAFQQRLQITPAPLPTESQSETDESG